MKTLLLLLMAISFNTFAQTPSGRNCEYYRDLESVKNCSTNRVDKSDYLINYGYFFCQQFLDKADEWGGARAGWLHRVAYCLQKKVQASAGKSCKQMESDAFSTHSDCYVSTGFCKLGITERASIIYSLMATPLFKKIPQTAREGIEVFGTCSAINQYQSKTGPKY